MSYNQVDTHDCHLFNIQLFSAETVVRYYGVCKFLGRLNKPFEGGLSLLLVDSKQVGQGDSFLFITLLVFQNSPTQPYIVVGIYPYC